MTALKINLIGRKFSNLSLTQKWIFMSLVTAVLLIIKTLCTESFLNNPSYIESDELLTDISSYSFWSNIVFFLSLISLFSLAIWSMKKQSQRIQQDLSTAIREGTFGHHANFSAQDEFNSMARMVCNETSKIEKRFNAQNKIVQELEGQIEPLISCMEIVNESVEEEFEQIELLATAMNEMTATVKEVAQNASSASTSTTEAATVAQEGSQFVDATITTIHSLSSNIGASAEAVNSVEVNVDGIGSVVDTIRSISDQTNLLALNAAIEAARAGEYGRGFAVVADEVRNLAKRTQESTVEIQGMIEQLQTSAQQAVSLMGKSVHEADVGVEQVTQAGAQLNDIVNKVDHISDMNYQIASAADQQTTVANDINLNLDQVKELVEGSVVVFKEITEMADEINKNVDILNKA